ncbi:MAG: FAD:protein FMN transferase, partial [Woeseiaceae bacterium]
MTRIFRVWLLGLVLCAGPPIELAQTSQPIRQAPGGAAPQHSLDRASTPRRAPLARYEFTRVLMGVPFKIALYALDNRSANEAAAEAYARIRELDSIMSDYDSESELMRLSRTAGQGKAVPVSEDLWIVLERSQ